MRTWTGCTPSRSFRDVDCCMTSLRLQGHVRSMSLWASVAVRFTGDTMVLFFQLSGRGTRLILESYGIRMTYDRCAHMTWEGSLKWDFDIVVK